MAIETNITSEAGPFVGDDLTIQLFEVKADGVTPKDITGWAIRFGLHKKGSTTDLFTLSGSQLDMTGSLLGLAGAVLPRSFTSTLAPAKYRYYFEKIDTGQDGVLAYGEIEFKQK